MHWLILLHQKRPQQGVNRFLQGRCLFLQEPWHHFGLGPSFGQPSSVHQYHPLFGFQPTDLLDLPQAVVTREPQIDSQNRGLVEVAGEREAQIH